MYITVEDSWKSGNASIRESFKTSPREMKQNQANTRKKKKRRGVIEATDVPSPALYKLNANVAYIQYSTVCLPNRI